MFKLPEVIQDLEENPVDLTLVQRLQIDKNKKYQFQGQVAYAVLGRSMWRRCGLSLNSSSPIIESQCLKSLFS